MSVIKKMMDGIENRAIKKQGWVLIPDSNIGFFYVYVGTYKGKKRILKDGCVVEKGDIVGEFHVNNNNVPHVTIKNVKWFENQIEQELIALAKNAEKEPFVHAKAFFGRTVLHPFVRRRGFEIMDIESGPFRIFLSLWDRLIMGVYSKSDMKKKMRETKEVWMSRKGLQMKLGE